MRSIYQLTVVALSVAILIVNFILHPNSIAKTVTPIDRPIAAWTGRLILPTVAEINKFSQDDWVWIELNNAPIDRQDLIDRRIALTWAKSAPIRSILDRLTTDINFTAATQNSLNQGTIHPTRLNGRKEVGILQSLAGARAKDDVLVKLSTPQILKLTDDRQWSLQIDREPVQISDRSIGLIKIIAPSNSEYFQVQHYDRQSRRFQGPIETIRIPQIPPTFTGLNPSSIRNLADSKPGKLGWYIYGHRDRHNLFTVTAMQPRSLYDLTLPPNRQINDRHSQLTYLNREHWQNLEQRKGTFDRVELNANYQPKIGDRALLIHLFGGIGGTPADIPGVWATVTGHFAYGIATVVEDEFTQLPRWAVEYNQVYAHNPDGIVAGKQDWATYMGHLQRGWLGTRPVADMLISYPPITEDYHFGTIALSPLNELQHQLQIMSARYRTGDGTGNASVNPATSCVQDANQALFLTIRSLTQQVQNRPEIRAWLAAHPQDSQTQRFDRLVSLGRELTTQLAPLGIVREDWDRNANKLAGIDGGDGFSKTENPAMALVTWRTMLPRGAQDGIVKIFSDRGAKVSIFNTNLVGGSQPHIVPIEPTILFGSTPILSRLILRVWAGFSTSITSHSLLVTSGLLFLYGSIALMLGFRTKFLNIERIDRTKLDLFKYSIWLFLMPALIEEFIFRLLLIPHPIETTTGLETWIWSAISIGLFVIYHPLNALTFFKQGNPTFMDWRFLLLAGWLGIVCTSVYLIAGTILLSAIVHWIVVVGWLFVGGGERRLTK
jgi:predicted Abi (CAAX) family protease